MDHSGLPSARLEVKENVPRILNPIKQSSPNQLFPRMILMKYWRKIDDIMKLKLINSSEIFDLQCSV